MTDDCQACRDLFSDSYADAKLADNIELQKPNCACEAVSVGQNSPGPVDDEETLVRMVIDPRDIDDGKVLERPFQDVYKNGLSVFRDIATDDDIRDLTSEMLWRTAQDPKASIWASFALPVSQLRSIVDDEGERIFAVYDQTVPRRQPELPPVPTHAGIFQRRPKKGVEARKTTQKNNAGELRKAFLQNQLSLLSYKNGLLATINGEADAGQFTEPVEAD